MISPDSSPTGETWDELPSEWVTPGHAAEEGGGRGAAAERGEGEPPTQVSPRHWEARSSRERNHSVDRRGEAPRGPIAAPGRLVNPETQCSVIAL